MLGQTLKERYKLTRILGAGGFGQTYLAIDIQQSDRPQCVVKQLRPASQDKTFLVVARRLFDTESKTLEKLGSHSQIPNSIDFFEEDHEFYLVQEFIDGESLEDEINQVGKFTEAQAIALLKDVLPVLSFIHDNHVVHRDLKPDNLIRRRHTGDIVLIDFGAVKEIRTHLITGERTGLTIGIGTQGYTPSEQLSGKPRYSSDIYALGMTVINALTGRSPTELPESLGSLEPQWRDYTEVSPGLAILLDKMTRHYIHQRYQSVEDVLHDLGRLEELPAEAAEAVTSIETAMPQGLASSEAKTVIVRWRMKRRARLLTVAISTLVTSAVVLGLRQVGKFVPAELAIWDNLTNTQADQGPDPRLLIVGVSEDDLTVPGRFTPSDTELVQAIDNLQMHQPARIGLDFLRSPTDDEGNTLLQKRLNAPNIFVVTQLSNLNSNNAVLPLNQLSFSNVVEDSDLRVRRSLMLGPVDDEGKERGDEVSQKEGRSEPLGDDVGSVSDSNPTNRSIFSFGTEAAIHYLGKYENIVPEGGDILQLGPVRFEKMTPSFGGYQNVDASGYQILLRYRSRDSIAERLSFTDVLNDTFDPALVKDKIVLIGPTTESSKDLFVTPLVKAGMPFKMYGVEVHAQAASQILSAVIDGDPLPWAWPDGVEVLWIVALTGIGSGLMVLTQRGPVLILFGVSGLAIALAVGVVSFHLGGWVPIAAPMSAFFLSAAGARISKSYQRRYWEAKQQTTDG